MKVMHAHGLIGLLVDYDNQSYQHIDDIDDKICDYDIFVYVTSDVELEILKEELKNYNFKDII